MTLTPELLRSWATRRLLAIAPELAASHDLSTPEGLRAAGEQLVAARTGEEAGGGSLAVCVIAELDLRAWIQETCQFAFRIPDADAQGWRRSFTRTVFLSGRPANLRDRFALGHTAEDGSTAWVGPAPAVATATLRRLLKTFEGSRTLDASPAQGTIESQAIELSTPPALGSVTRPTTRPPLHRELHVATAGVTLAQVLVHLNHLLVEAVFDGVVVPGDRLTVLREPRLSGVRSPIAALRADTEPHRPDRFRAYALLTEEC